MTFGIFSGLSAQFGLLIRNLYGAGNPANANPFALLGVMVVGGDDGHRTGAGAGRHA